MTSMDYESLPTRQVNWNKAVDLSGRVYGKLRVLRPVVWKPTATKGIFWLCMCECGKYTVVLGQNLTKGTTISCKCERSVRQRNNINSLRKLPDFVEKQRIAASVSITKLWKDETFSARVREATSNNMRRLNNDPAFLQAHETRIRSVRIAKGVNPDQAISRLSTQIRHALNDFRKWIFRRDGYKCLCCGSSHTLQLHHFTKIEGSWEHVANPLEVGTFCRTCHKQVMHNGNYRGSVNTEQTRKYRDIVRNSEQHDPMNADLVRSTNERISRILEDAGVHRDSFTGDSIAS